jgi:hypothetical protein
MSNKLNTIFKYFLKQIIENLDEESVDTNYNANKNVNVPDITGTWNQVYKIHRIPEVVYEEIQKETVSKDYLKNYKFRYTIGDSPVILKQDDNDNRFATLFTLSQDKVRPDLGIQPILLTKISDNKNWTFICQDYDDNGSYIMEIYTDDNNKAYYMRGSYGEAGFNNFSKNQLPTTGMVELVRLSDSISIPDNEIIPRKNNLLKRNKVSVNEDKKLMVNNIEVFLNDLTLFYDTNLLISIPGENNGATKYSIKFIGPLFADISSSKNNKLIDISNPKEYVYLGEVESLNYYEIIRGTNVCNVDVKYYIFDDSKHQYLSKIEFENFKKMDFKKEVEKFNTQENLKSRNWNDMLNFKKSIYAETFKSVENETEDKNFISSFSFKTSYQGGLNNGNFLLGIIKKDIETKTGISAQNCVSCEFSGQPDGIRKINFPTNWGPYGKGGTRWNP